MLIGVPKEVKTHEFRVGLTATSVKELVGSGHSVMVQAGAGDGIGQDDAVYRRAGATVVDGAKEVYGQADLIVKVKELQPSEYDLLRLHYASGRGRRPGHALRATRPGTGHRGQTSPRLSTVMSGRMCRALTVPGKTLPYWFSAPNANARWLTVADRQHGGHLHA
jgi:hypothetical protein